MGRWIGCASGSLPASIGRSPRRVRRPGRSHATAGVRGAGGRGSLSEHGGACGGVGGAVPGADAVPSAVGAVTGRRHRAGRPCRLIR